MNSQPFIKLGRFLFRYRNALGPVMFLVALAVSRPHYPFGRPELDLVFDVAGIIVAFAGQFVRAITIGYEYIVRGGRNRQVYADGLVQGGIFAHSRNPMYVGNILIALGFALVVHAWAFYLIVIPGIVIAYASIVAAEEAYLREKFGAEYESYARRVNRWVPRLAGFRDSLRGMRFNWARVVVKEYGTFFVMSAALFGVYLWSKYSVAGADALPSYSLIGAVLAAWIALYFTVRALKKSGFVSDRPADGPT